MSYKYYIAILAKAIYYGMSKSSDHLDRATYYTRVLPYSVPLVPWVLIAPSGLGAK